MIDMRVCQKHEIELGGVEREGSPVEGLFLLAALMHPAIDKETDVSYLDHIARAGDLASGPTDFKEHSSSSDSETDKLNAGNNCTKSCSEGRYG
jgi:hypothetical protein